MANDNENAKNSKVMQKPRPAPDRMEDEAALRNALVSASLRVKRLAQKETEAESAGEEILHFRLKGG
jgi:hypothetical protein